MKIARTARDAFQFDTNIFDDEGNLTFSTFRDVHLFVQRLNENRESEAEPIYASDINGLVLESTIFETWLNSFQPQAGRDVIKELFTYLEDQVGKEELESTLKEFLVEFPPPGIYSDRETINQYLEAAPSAEQNKKHTLTSMIVLWISNENPVFSRASSLMDDTSLAERTTYQQIISIARNFFQTQPPIGEEDQTLFEMLYSLRDQDPTSIRGQLEYIRDHWGYLLGDYEEKILQALDFIAEEEKMRGGGPGEAQVYTYDSLADNYSVDGTWMPQVVMIAKNILVWLDQLSKKYNQKIHLLDQVPNEELIQLKQWGFNTLWLIGIWERSPASKVIKRWSGNPEAEASAYSIHEYKIAQNLGGHDALRSLKERARDIGIRLACDMVTNHTGIDSKWVIEHPEWFISLPYAPFPSYRYSGANVSNDPRIGIYIEDQYFSRTDAAVTFKRVDHDTNETSYVYHGNDGTSIPWVDTAQINYLNSEVREAVIQTILQVAKMFRVIRFDAAMTLTRKHYQRLWFPAPGTGGDIPSRAEHGISNQEFAKAMPKEFWRQVVDRVNQDAPDTLLIAEAFWLLEGYFVKTLGMHRVYNSAFMNMLRDEDNAKYRLVVKNTLEYDPEILKRFVNFMNNPDEETAVSQFGKGEKYFGICVLLATMPGLPLFGHGQIEGYEERYGMEYSKAYWNETLDVGFVEFHEEIIFPLLKRRYLFAEVTNFWLYDCYNADGTVDEDVFIYSNGQDGNKVVVIYHNRHKQTSGWIKISSMVLIKEHDGTSKLVQTTIGESLGLHSEEEYFVRFRDVISTRDYLRKSKEILEQGLYIKLGPYQAMVLMDIQEVIDTSGVYGRLYRKLAGSGVRDLDQEIGKI
ncbi:MAG: alpha-amylase family glycosyl hydrolase [Candidatus Heimdallarchaeota archaeon]